MSSILVKVGISSIEKDTPNSDSNCMISLSCPKLSQTGNSCCFVEGYRVDGSTEKVVAIVLIIRCSIFMVLTG
jgi:hypothetical protein